MAAAPFGAPGWQLPLVAAYLARLHRTQEPPDADAFAAYLAGKRAGQLPAPHQPYGYDPLHDPRVCCWLDLHTEPAQGSEQWPRCSLVVLQQETGRCGWTRITRHRGAYAVIAHTLTETAAEAQRLADTQRTRPHPGTAAVQEMATQLRDWTRRLHQQAKAEQTLIQAGRVRSAMRRTT